MFLVLFGPPASGKTTVGTLVAASSRLPFLRIDDYVLRGLEEEYADFTDSFIHERLRLMLREAVQEGAALLEVAFHDSSSLVATLAAELPAYRLISFHAPLSDLMARNASRPALRRVPEDYIRRCHSASLKLRSIPGSCDLALETTTAEPSTLAALVGSLVPEPSCTK